MKLLIAKMQLLFKTLMTHSREVPDKRVEVPRIGKRQTIETLINEEALLFAKFLRGERKK